ncbi:MAG: extracellular solute-binding protein, partial [Planctomycetota bacterium]
MAAPKKLPIRGRRLAALALAALVVWVGADLATGAGVWTPVARYLGGLLESAGPTRNLIGRVRTAGGGDRPVQLRVWDWWSPSTNEKYSVYFGELERRFEQAHPEVDIVSQTIPFGSYEQKLATAMLGKSPPDVFQCSVVWAQGLHRRGIIRELDDFLKDTPELQKERFMASAWYHNNDGGRTYGIPIIIDAACMLWNLEMIRDDPELHFMFERNPDGTADFTRIRFDAVRDWEHFRWIMKRLTKSPRPGGTKVRPAGMAMNAYSMGARSYMPWAAANGVALQDREGTRATFNTPAGVETFQFMVDLQWTDGVCPEFERKLKHHESFVQREVACAMAGTWSGKGIERDTQGWQGFGMTAFPPGPHGKGQRTVAWANMMVISSRCRRPDLAWEYIRLVAGEEGAGLRLNLLRMNSPRLDFYEGDA